MNLLTDPVLRVETASGLKNFSLPSLLEALGNENVKSFPGLQRHQEDAFYVFLCYLSAAILARSGRDDPVQSKEFWRQGMRQLAGEAGDNAWRLVVEDLSKPAFLQPPLPMADQSKLKLLAESPDALDLLPTAKNHDVKRDRAGKAQSDEWVFALVSLQTMSGYFGRGNPGIARMNSGFGNRPVVEIAHDLRWGARFRQAIPRLLEHRQGVLPREWEYDPNGMVLTWLEPWDGKTSIQLSRLDPFFLEICRRVRLRGDPIMAFSVPSDKNRIEAKNLKGIVGDAWLPVILNEESKALTVSAQGWTPDLLRRLLFGEEFQLTPLQRPLSCVEGPLWLVASVLVRGQGTTDGFHERRIPIPPQARRHLFGSSPLRASLQSLSKNAIEYAGKMQNSVLKPAVFAYLQGGPNKIQFDDPFDQATWERFQRSFETAWSDAFFPWLWSVPEPIDEELALRQWAEKLKSFALEVLRQVEHAMPSHAGRNYKAKVVAERRFYAGLFKNFPFLKEAPHADA